MRLATRIVIIVAILGLLTPIKSTYCWESDMHYGLTKWLAFKAGFSLEDAEIIASGSESADESNVLKATAVMTVFVCLWKSAEASRHVQMHHFPSDGFVPAKRQSRKVCPGKIDLKNGGNRWVRQELAVPSANANRETVLNRFGQSLHPLADSWSHQGVPGKGFPTCSENLIWAHSDQRGGWMSHDADLTHEFVEDAVASAEAAHHFMEQFLKVNPKLRGSNYDRRKPWKELEGDVRAFAKAKTAFEKETWFKNHPEVPLDSYSTYPCFLRNTSLKNHDQICKKKDNQKKRDQLREKRIFGHYSHQNGVVQFFESFLIDWIVEGNIDKIISKSMDVNAIKQSLLQDKQKDLKINNRLWLKTLLLMWLVPDHGLVNELGHGIPNRKGFNTLADIADSRRQRMKFTNLREAIQFPGTSMLYQFVELGPLGLYHDSFAVIFQFRHTPRDMLFLIANKKNAIYKVVGFFWMAS